MLLIFFSQNFGSVGSPPPATQAKVVDVNDPDMIGLGPEQKGEILIRGPHIMKGYYKNETATKGAFAKNGWLRTGDIGYYDKDFQFYITDRLKELIKVKGFQVAPAELEEILKCHPHVAGKCFEPKSNLFFNKNLYFFRCSRHWNSTQIKWRSTTWLHRCQAKCQN